MVGRLGDEQLAATSGEEDAQSISVPNLQVPGHRFWFQNRMRVPVPVPDLNPKP